MRLSLAMALVTAVTPVELLRAQSAEAPPIAAVRSDTSRYVRLADWVFGPGPELRVWRDDRGVRGELLVRYAFLRTLPDEGLGRDFERRERTRLVETYGCTEFVEEKRFAMCRAPFPRGEPSWGAVLAALDSADVDAPPASDERPRSGVARTDSRGWVRIVGCQGEVSLDVEDRQDGITVRYAHSGCTSKSPERTRHWERLRRVLYAVEGLARRVEGY